MTVHVYSWWEQVLAGKKMTVSYVEKLVCDRKKQEKVDKCSKLCRVIPFMGSIVDGVGNYSSLQHTTNDNS